MCENVKNYCRICLDVESEHIPILGDAAIPLHIKTCLAMTVSATDPLPKDICISCASQLSDFYSFKLNAMFSLDWLESCIQEKSKKAESKYQPVQPLPDCEYNSDSLLEFLNNTANIEEYLNNLGREDIPSIVNMLDRNNENSMEAMNKAARNLKIPSPKKKEIPSKVKSFKMNMQVDALDSDIEIVNEILMKELEPKKQSHKVGVQSTNGLIIPNTGKLLPKPGKIQPKNERPQTTPQKSAKLPISPVKAQTNSKLHPSPVKLKLKTFQSTNTCFACKLICSNFQKLSRHLNTCDFAVRTCILCEKLFDSKHQMLQHSLTHNLGNSHNCVCGKEFPSKEGLLHHHNLCQMDYTTMMGYLYRCKECKQTFNQRALIYHHVKEHLKTEAKRIICGSSFLGEKQLERDKKEDHNIPDSNELLYRCKVCSHTSPSHQELYSHVQKHLAPEFGHHLCDVCGNSFKTRTTLLRHSLTHQKVNIKERDKVCNGNNETKDHGKLDEVKLTKLNGVKRPYSETEMDANDQSQCNDFLNTLDLHQVKKDSLNNVSGHLDVIMCDKCGQCVTRCEMAKHFCA